MFTVSTYAIIGGALLFIALFFFVKNGEVRSVHQAIQRAKASGEPTAIVACIRNKPLNEREDLWDQALSHLWQSYDREMVAKVLNLALAPVEKTVVSQSDTELSTSFEPSPDYDVKILHYWVNQVMQVEPDIAREYFSDEFMKYGYRPDLARCCGKGCCG